MSYGGAKIENIYERLCLCFYPLRSLFFLAVKKIQDTFTTLSNYFWSSLSKKKVSY